MTWRILFLGEFLSISGTSHSFVLRTLAHTLSALAGGGLLPLRFP